MAAHPTCRAWLTFQSHRGLAGNTLDAYSRGLEAFLHFLSDKQLSVPAVTPIHIGSYLASLQSCAGYLSNATVQQRLTVLRLFYAYLIEEGLCKKSPVGQAGSHALVRLHRKLPWIPNENDWQAILTAAMTEPVRNRVMLTFAYDAGLRREELCSLCTEDLDPSRRMIRVRAENTKGRRDRVVPYSATSGALLMQYLDQRRAVGQKRGRLFLSESRRNYSASDLHLVLVEDHTSNRTTRWSHSIHNPHASSPVPDRFSPCRLGHPRDRNVCRSSLGADHTPLYTSQRS